MRLVAFIAIAFLLTGCGEHPSKAKRQEFRQHIKDFKPVEDAPLVEPAVEHDDARLRETEAELQAVRDELAEAKKGGFTGAILWKTKVCPACVNQENDIKARKDWTIGADKKFHFWVRDSSEVASMPGTPKLRYVPTTDYYVDGKYIGRVEGYGGSKAALDAILAKHPKSELLHKAAMADSGIGQAMASVPPVFPPPAPPAEETIETIETMPAMQVGCGAPAVVASDCGGFQSSCAAPMSYGCGAPQMPYGCAAPQYSYSQPVYSQPRFYGVQAGGFRAGVGSACPGGVCFGW